MSTGDYGRASGPRSGFWRRFAAYLIDVILLGIVGGILEVALKGVGYGLSILLYLAYFTYFEGSTGQTPGDRALGTRVVDFETGNSIGYGRGLVRSIARYLSALVLFLGYFWMLWDREKQTWHDKIAGSVVVPLSAYPIGYSHRESSTSVTY